MKEVTKEPDAGKEALKRLKAARKDQIAGATARMKIQRQAVKAIKEQLKDGELTVPELAQATGLAAAEVLYYVASLKKFGEILEGSKDGGYYRYRLGKVIEETPQAE
jgi:predicted transcriptional regulator